MTSLVLPTASKRAVAGLVFEQMTQSSLSFSWFKTQQDVGTRGLWFTELKSEDKQTRKQNFLISEKNTSVLNKRFLKTG